MESEQMKKINRIQTEERNEEDYEPVELEDIDEDYDDYYYDMINKCYMIRKNPHKTLWFCTSEVETGQKWYFIEENGLMKEITEKQFDEMNDHKKYRVYLNSCGIGSLQSYCERSYIEIIWKENKQTQETSEGSKQLKEIENVLNKMKDRLNELEEHKNITNNDNITNTELKETNDKRLYLYKEQLKDIIEYYRNSIEDEDHFNYNDFDYFTDYMIKRIDQTYNQINEMSDEEINETLNTI